MDKRILVDLGFTSERVPEGSHTCLFYRDEAFKNRMILKYIAAGIRNGEKVVCLTDSLTKEEIINWFRTEKVDTGGNNPERGLIVESTKMAYYPEGYFHPEEMIARWRRYSEEAMAEGFRLLRATGEITWLTAGIPGAERFVEYDLIINERLKDLPVFLLCQFDTNRVPGTILMELLNAHPMIITNGQIMYNPLYHSPQKGRRFFFRRKRERTYRCEQISAVLLIVTALLKLLPTSEIKAEFTANFLQTVFRLQDYYLSLDGYTLKKGSWTEMADPASVKAVRIDIRTVDAVFGYLFLPSRWGKADPRLRALLSNYLNLLALSLESTKYKEGLERLNRQLTAEIAERKKIENRLRQNEQWFNATMEGTDEGLWEWDVTTGAIKYDENWQRILGYQPGEVVFNQEWFQRNTHPEDWPLVVKAIKDYMNGDKKYVEWECRFKTKSGVWKRVWCRGVCLAKSNGADGKPLKLSGTNRDITLYRETEEALQVSVQELAAEKEQTTLLKMQKLESLGMLASGIAHDFNNLLAAILSNVQLAAFKLGKGLDGRKELQAIEKATLKAAKLTKQLMTFAKGGAPVKQPAKLAEIIKETAEFALRGATVKCQYLLPADLWPVEVDGDQISQVIQNLMLNAYQAMPDGGVIKVSARNVVVSPQNRMWLRPGHYVRVEIEDQGMGIPAEMLTKIFDPYFTTKKEGHGLGLSSSYYIIQNHDGYLGVQSRVGEGSTFYFYLPAAMAKPVGEKKGKKSFYLQGKGKVLLMDDEPMIRASLREYLERCGYEAVVAKDGSEAVNLYAQEKKNQAPFDVVILDLTVPGGMGGKEAVRHILALDPEAKVVASSGYSDDPVMSEYQKFGFCGVVSKPFKMEELCAKIKGLLEPLQVN